MMMCMQDVLGGSCMCCTSCLLCLALAPNHMSSAASSVGPGMDSHPQFNLVISGRLIKVWLGGMCLSRLVDGAWR